MSHYETLGVTDAATPDEIKRAYRSKAKTAHPDAGGSPSDFEPIVKAYEVLKDPERRLLYDTTGEDKRLPIDVEVQNILVQGFNAAFACEEDIEILAFVRKGIEAQTRMIPGKRRELKDRKKKLESKRQKITAKGVNVAHMLIDAELKNIDGQLLNLDHQNKIAEACLKALDGYNEDWAPPAPIDEMSFFTTSVRGQWTRP